MPANPLVDPLEVVRALRLSAQHRTEQETARAALSRLTPREREILAALAQGLTDTEIAEQLHIRHETVRTHMVNVLHKLGVDSRLKALVFAVRHGLVAINAVDLE